MGYESDIEEEVSDGSMKEYLNQAFDGNQADNQRLSLKREEQKVEDSIDQEQLVFEADTNLQIKREVDPEGIIGSE